MHIISHTGIFSSPACLALITFFLPPAKFCFSHDKYVSSEQWLDCARQVCHVTGEKSHFYCYVRMLETRRLRVGSEPIWWWPYSTRLLRQELKQFDALIGGCWYPGLVPYHEQMLHISSSAHQITPSHDILSIMSCTSQTYLVGWVTGIHFIMMEYERFCASSWINFTF